MTKAAGTKTGDGIINHMGGRPSSEAANIQVFTGKYCLLSSTKEHIDYKRGQIGAKYCIR